MILTDSHCHLQAPELAGVLDEVWNSGISRWVVNGLHPQDWPRVSELARTQRRVMPCFGLHPWHLAARSSSWLEQLEEMILNHPGCGLGEFGLDRWIRDFDAADQRLVFEAQWRLGVRLHLPMTIHCLKAWGALEEEFRSLPRPERGFLLHAYGGPVEMVADWVKRDAYFSFSTSFLASSRTSKRAAFQAMPLDRLLIETDAPSMPPPPECNAHPLKDPVTGSVLNHPANLPQAAIGLAELRGIPVPEMLGILEDNFDRWWGSG